MIHVDAADLANREGCGWIDGVLGRISIPSVERLQCAGTTRLVVTGKDGEPLHLGRKKRRFTRAQRRALAARDGGCAFPGCRAPVAWTEAHHIDWWKRDHGRTDIENGLLLCTFHHHLIHSTDEWEIRDPRTHPPPRPETVARDTAETTPDAAAPHPRRTKHRTTRLTHRARARVRARRPD